MANELSQDEIAARFAKLSPERRALLERTLRARTTVTDSVASDDIPHVDATVPTALSFAQEFLWLLERAHPGLAAYNVPRAFRVSGALDVTALEGALTDLVEQHQLLRTRIDSRSVEPRQSVAAALPVKVERVSAKDDDALRALLRGHARRSFDLEKDQLLRAVVVDVGSGAQVFQFVVHHIASDGWSRTITLRDLGAAYASRKQGAPPTFEPVPFSYVDWSAWQRGDIGREAMAADLAYWRTTLAGVPSLLDLPTDRPRATAAPTFAGARMLRRVPTSLRENLSELARAHNASRFMVLLAAYAALLHRYTHQDDILVGSPVAGRARTELQGIVGLFANTLVLRISCEGDPSFAELVDRVRKASLEAFDHQQLPFERLASEIGRGNTTSPLLQTLFSLVDGTPPRLELDGCVVESMEVEPGWSKVELTIGAAEQDEGLSLLAEYRTDLFDDATISRLLDHYIVLLESVTADPGVRLSALSLVDANERSALLALGRGDPADVSPVAVHALVEAQCAATPNAIAASDASTTLTYRELDSRANKLAHHLIARGVSPGSAVGICLPRTVDMLVALLATLKVGAHYVPLDPDYPSERLSFIAQDANLSVALMTSATRDRIPLADARVLNIDDEWKAIAARSEVRPDVKTSRHDLMYVLHTSGSTGKPKGVMIPHRAVVNFLTSMRARPGLSSKDAVVAVTTLSFDIAGLELWLPLIVGARVVIASRAVATDGVALATLLQSTAAAVQADNGVVMLQATPATWRLLIEGGWSGSRSVRMLCGGEAWTQELAAALIPRGESLWNMYGPTETTIWSSVARVRTPSDVVLGDPISNTTLMVLDSRLEPVPRGVAGELYIGGAGVAIGYLNREDLTSERFIRDPFSLLASARMYRTGDLVRRTTAGTLEYLGRVDQQIKIRGFRIELGEIEVALRGAPGVADAVVIGRVETASADPTLVAYVTPLLNAALTPDALRDSLRGVLPDYMVPSTFVRLDAFPLTANGKIDRRALPAPSASDATSKRESAPPSTPLERQIADAWTDTLGIQSVGVDDDFFSVGGHSLLAMRVVARLARELPVRVAIGDIFGARTVGALAALVESRLSEVSEGASDDDLASALAELDAMSDDDARRLVGGDNRS